jgi:hypothetical protein
MEAQSDPSPAPPEDGQRSHSYVNEVGLSVHVPSEVVSVWPTAAVPVIAGSTVLLGTALVLAEPTGESSAAAINIPSSNARAM